MNVFSSTFYFSLFSKLTELRIQIYICRMQPPWKDKITKLIIYYSKGHHHWEAILAHQLKSVQDMLKATVQDLIFKNCSAPLMPTWAPYSETLPTTRVRKVYHTGESSNFLFRSFRNEESFNFLIRFENVYYWKKLSWLLSKPSRLITKYPQHFLL